MSKNSRQPSGYIADHLYSDVFPFPLLFMYNRVQVLYFTLHFNGLFSIPHYRTVITHRPTLRYGSGFIAFPWSWVFLSSAIVLSQAAYGDPSLGLTPLINSARRSAGARRLRLAGSWGRLIGSELRLARLCSSLERAWTAGWPLEGSRACCDKWAFSSLSHHRIHIATHACMYVRCTQTYTNTQTGSVHHSCEYCITPKKKKKKLNLSCMQAWLPSLW